MVVHLLKTNSLLKFSIIVSKKLLVFEVRTIYRLRKIKVFNVFIGYNKKEQDEVFLPHLALSSL